MSEWTTVQEESPDLIIFDEHGDEFVGKYEGAEEIDNGEGETFTRYLFKNDDGFFGINASYRLRQAFAKVTPGSLVRITYVKDVDTSNGKLNPMKDYRVEVAR